MAKFDLESFRDYFLTMIQSAWAAKIAEINAEKSDAITLQDIPSAQYFSDLNESVVNFNEFIHYEFGEIQTITQPRMPAAMVVEMAVAVVVTDPQSGLSAENKALRYTRALAEIIMANASKNPQIGGVEIEVFAPISPKENLLSGSTKVGGIIIKGVLSS